MGRTRKQQHGPPSAAQYGGNLGAIPRQAHTSWVRHSNPLVGVRGPRKVNVQWERVGHVQWLNNQQGGGVQ